jgi:hypothetical protein
MSQHPDSIGARAIARVLGDPSHPMQVLARGKLLRATEGAGNPGFRINVGQIAQIVAAKG